MFPFFVFITQQHKTAAKDSSFLHFSSSSATPHQPYSWWTMLLPHPLFRADLNIIFHTRWCLLHSKFHFGKACFLARKFCFALFHLSVRHTTKHSVHPILRIDINDNSRGDLHWELLATTKRSYTRNSLRPVRRLITSSLGCAKHAWPSPANGATSSPCRSDPLVPDLIHF